MAKISKHFKRSEIACKCGCGLDTMDAETLKIADDARDFVNHSITPSSGARCPTHNKAVGGSKNSKHCECRAMDLPVDDPKALYVYLCAKYPGRYGFGLYKTFVHADSRTYGSARWVG